MQTGVFQLVYVSQAVDHISYSDLKSILETSRERNLTANITGLLIYRDGWFLQLLEGPERAVLETLSRIVMDRRNHHLQVLHETAARSRLFAQWSMAFQDGDLADVVRQPLVERLFQMASSAQKPRLEIMAPLAELATLQK